MRSTVEVPVVGSENEARIGREVQRQALDCFVNAFQGMDCLFCVRPVLMGRVVNIYRVQMDDARSFPDAAQGYRLINPVG